MPDPKLIIGITMGDPAGIGPEIIVRYFQETTARPIMVIGDQSILQEVAKQLGISVCLRAIHSLEEAKFDNTAINVLDLNNISPSEIIIGQPGAACGRASVQYIEKAIELCQTRAIQAMVTAPINKEAVHLAGFQFAGHTEMLAYHTNTSGYAMMLAGKGLRVVLVTTHASIADVAVQISRERVLKTIRLTDQWLEKFYPQQREIAVCGLNPHAGENGLFGREEIEAISPAVALAKAEGIPVEGPFAADALFYQAQKGIFGAVVVMYHDQGLIPLKMLAFDEGVNITLGLPIIRTSVDHGTAYDIAWQGRAETSSLAAAVKIAGYLASRSQGE